MIKNLLYLTLLALSLLACHRNNNSEKKSTVPNQEELLRINKYLVKKDADAIKGYIQRHGWNMTQTQTGLWFEIIKKGRGPKAENGQQATLAFKVWLLDGTLCYSSDLTGNKSFSIGKGGVEPGLEQGILLLNEGDKARFIMPPHLAYGLIGDENKIPARATIVYEVDLIKITDQK